MPSKESHQTTGKARQAGKETESMKNWKTEKALYHIVEISRGGKEEYNMLMTGNEVGAWCKMKNEAYGYIRGCGGDRSYSCWAVIVTY